MTLPSSESKLPGNWPAIWRVAEQIVTLRWWLQVVSLKLDKYDPFIYGVSGRLIEELSLAVRGLVEPVELKDRLRDAVRAVWESAPYCIDRQLQHLADLKRIHQLANQDLAEAEDGSEEYDNIHVRYCKQVMRYAEELEAQLNAAVEHELEEVQVRLFRFCKMLDEGRLTRDVDRAVYWWRPRHLDPDLPVEGRPLFALNEPIEGAEAPRAIWFKEVQARWTELGLGTPFPMLPFEELGPKCLDPDKRRRAFEQVKTEIRALLAASVAGQSDDSPVPIVGTRSELNRAFGKSRKYANFLERQASKGILELQKDCGDGRRAIVIRDPILREKIRSKLESIQA